MFLLEFSNTELERDVIHWDALGEERGQTW